MEALRILLKRVTSVFRRGKLDRDLDEELQSHLALATEENMRRGMSRKAARKAALLSFGGLTQTKEAYRTQRGLPLVEQMARDLRFACRQLIRAPGFALTAVLTLALGLGANTAVFSLINGLLLRPLPVPRASQLAVLRYERSDREGPDYYFCSPIFRALEKRKDIFQNTAAFTGTNLQLRGSSGTEEVFASIVSGQFFELMETPPQLGRYLTPQDDQTGNPNGFAVVISDSFWRTWFHGAPDILGRKLATPNAIFTIVGVMPRSFIGANPTSRPNVYLPLSAEPILDAPYDNLSSGYTSWWLQVIARRNPGVTVQQADAALQAITNSLVDATSPDANTAKETRAAHFRLGAESGVTGFNYYGHTFRKPLLLVFSLCAGVLLLACLNLASLLMARSAARERELATRLAIGATRRRLIQQLLVESLLIAVLGAAAGLAVAPLVSHSLAALLAGTSTNTVLDTTLDTRVLGFVALIAIVATALIGLLPALRATSGDLSSQMKAGCAGSGLGSAWMRSQRNWHRWLPRILMASEVGLALILVVGAGLLSASLVRLYRTGLGFNPKGIVDLSLDMDKQSLHGEALARWYREYADAVGHLPGVSNVSYEMMTPLSGSWSRSTFHTPVSQGERQLYTNTIGPGYFATMQIALLQGREFSWQDVLSASAGDSGSNATPRTQKIVLNETAAKLLFPGQNPLGQLVLAGKDKRLEVVGVVHDTHYTSIRQEPPPTAFHPMQVAAADKLSIDMIVRLTGPVAPFAAATRSLTVRMAPEIPAPILTTMSGQLDDSIRAERMMAMLSVFFAVCALLVTAIGLYGTLAYATARRTSEIGIRLALGSPRMQVIALVFRENAWIALTGAVGGLIAALLWARALSSLLYGTSANDPIVLIASVGALFAVASAASLLPALRASRIEPIQALRTE
jgi:predicted permease